MSKVKDNMKHRLTERLSPKWKFYDSSSVQFSHLLCLTLCKPMDCRMLDFPVHHQLPELTKTHVHRVSDAIQLSYPLSSLLFLPPIFPSIRVFCSESVLHIRSNYYRVSASISVFPMNTQDWFSLGWTGWISLQSKRFSRVFSNTTVQKHQFFRAQLSL